MYDMIFLDWRTEYIACQYALRRVYRLMEEQGVLSRTLNDGTIKTSVDFTDALLGTWCMPFIVCEKKTGDIAACCWFNCIEGRMCRGHFWVDKKFWGRESIKIIRQCLWNILHYNDDKGFLFDTIIGITPASNSLAWRLITKCGGNVVATIPHACQHEDSIEDGILTVTTRESLGDTL